MRSTSLLDNYLQTTRTEGTRHSVPAQPHEQLDSSTRATEFKHRRAIGNIHHALDDVLTTADSLAGGSQQQQTWLGALADRNRGSTAVGVEQPASPAHSKATTGRRDKALGQQVRGIFRSMRQADATALLEQKLQAEHEQQQPQEQQQQPIFPAPEDRSNSTVRIIAGNAALQSKLQRLQADMDAKSYRQDLLQQLQTPTAMFPPRSQVQQQRAQPQQQPGKQQQQGDPYQWLRISGSRPGDVSLRPGPGSSLTRPGTSPAMGNIPHSHVYPAAAYSTAATAGDAHSSSYLQGEPVFIGPHISRVAVSHTREHPGTAEQQFQHLKELLQYEPPWLAGGRAAAAAQQRSSGGGCPGSVYRPRDGLQQRPWTSSAAATARRKLETSSRSVGLRQQAPAASKQQIMQTIGHHYQQQQEHMVPRPASAVAALEQSLSELASLRSRLSQQQQQLEAPLHHQPPTQQQAPSQLQHNFSSSGWQEQQQPCRQQEPPCSTWLQDSTLQQHFARSGGGGTFATAAALLRQPAYNAVQSAHHSLGVGHISGIGGEGCAINPGHRGFSVLGAHIPEPELVVQDSQLFSHRRSVSPGYGVWDAWQHQVHQRPAAAAAELGMYGSYSLARSKSAPRRLRAWDVMPVPQASAAGADLTSHHRSRRYSTSGLLTGHVQLLRQQQHQQQQSCRPKTTGGIQHLGQQQQRGSRPGVRPLGLHNETVGQHIRALAKPAAISAKFGLNTSTHAAKPSAWLVSSPLQRTKQQLASAAARGRMSSTGGAATFAAVSGAGRRANAVAATLAGSAAAATARPGATTAAQTLAGTGSPAKAPGRTAAAAAQLLQTKRETRGLAGNTNASRGIVGGLTAATAAGRALSPTLTYSDRLSAVTGRSRSSAGGKTAAAHAPLAQQVKAYAAHRYKSPHALRSSESSDMSSEDNRPARIYQQSGGIPSAYAAALARVRAATAAGGDTSSDSESD